MVDAAVAGPVATPDVRALLAFAGTVAAVSVMTVIAGRRRSGSRSTQEIVPDVVPGEEFTQWALAGRRHGTVMTWFLLGGSIFTAYTFIAVPALVYGVGALGFFAVPYTIIVFQLAYLVLPWIWRRAAVHGWVTPADIVRDRFGSPWLALAVAVTGLLATMPYIALQLLGLSALLTAMGVPARGPVADLALTVTFAVLAVGTYRHGLRAPALIAVVKGVLIFAVTILLSVVVLHATGGAASLFTRAGTELTTRPGGSLLLPHGLASSYVSLAVGSALALLLYPHVLLPTFAARSADVLRRNASGLLAWTAVLAVLALGGLAAAALGITVPIGKAELAVPVLVLHVLPPVPAGFVLGAIGIGALVPAAVMSVAVASTFASNVYLEFVNPTALPAQVTRVARIVSVIVKIGALAFVLGLRAQDAITLQLLGGVWILQTLPAVLLGLITQWPHRYALLAGLLGGLGVGTWLVTRQGYVAVTELAAGGHSVGVYAGLVALAVNLAVVAITTPLLDWRDIGRGTDSTGSGIRGTVRQEWESGV